MLCLVMFFFVRPAMAGVPQLEDLTFLDRQGNLTTLAPWRGHSLLIAFWSPDCAPCLREMEALPALSRENPDLPILLVCLKTREACGMKGIPAFSNVHFLISRELPQTLFAAFGNTRALALPYSVMLNAQHAICGTHYGMLAPQTVDTWKKQCRISR